MIWYIVGLNELIFQHNATITLWKYIVQTYFYLLAVGTSWEGYKEIG